MSRSPFEYKEFRDAFDKYIERRNQKSNCIFDNVINAIEIQMNCSLSVNEENAIYEILKNRFKEE